MPPQRTCQHFDTSDLLAAPQNRGTETADPCTCYYKVEHDFECCPSNAWWSCYVQSIYIEALSNVAEYTLRPSLSVSGDCGQQAILQEAV